MCLYILKNLNNHRYTYKMKKFWKKFRLSSIALESPIYTHEWLPGWNKCDRIVKNPNEVHNGIHVTLDKQIVTQERKICLPVYANACDLIAYGDKRDAAFKKVFLKKEDYFKAFEAAKLLYGSQTIKWGNNEGISD